MRSGATHLAFRVEDVVTAHRALTSAGVTTRSRPVEVTNGISWAGSRCFYALDPDGVTVEFIERRDAADSGSVGPSKLH